MKIKLVLLSSLLFIALSAFSQTSKVSCFSGSASTFQQEDKLIEIKLDENITIEDTSIVIKEGTKSIQFKFKITLNTGTLKIEIYSPDGKKEEKDMIIDSQYSCGDSKSKAKKGSTEKKIIANFIQVKTNPQAGKWKVRIVPNKAEGNITINYSCSR